MSDQQEQPDEQDEAEVPEPAGITCSGGITIHPLGGGVTHG